MYFKTLSMEQAKNVLKSNAACTIITTYYYVLKYYKKNTVLVM